jgi:hypothetical protein
MPPPDKIISNSSKSESKASIEITNEEAKTNVKLNESNLNIIYMLANTAQCYAKLSYKSHKHYDQIQYGLTMPVIFFSTIIGTASFTTISMEHYFVVSMVIGSINILISILTTVLRYFKISEYNEMYRVSYISWDAFVRDILITLPNINDDKNFEIYFNKKLIQYSNLMENTPIFPMKIINKFGKYTKQINNEYFKPSQINKEIISIQSYMEKFKVIKGTNIDNYIEQNQTQQTKKAKYNIDYDTDSDNDSCLGNIYRLCKCKYILTNNKLEIKNKDAQSINEDIKTNNQNIESKNEDVSVV